MAGPSSCGGELQSVLSLQLNPPLLHPGIKSLFDQLFIHFLKIVATEGCSESLRIIQYCTLALRQDSHEPNIGWLPDSLTVLYHSDPWPLVLPALSDSS